MSPSDDTLRYASGQVLAGRFRIVRLLGVGGMGEVYEAADLDLHRHIALKLIRPESRTDPKLLSLLREEVRQARSVSHCNVCRVYDLGRDEASGVAFVTMELVRGETLRARLRRSGSFQAAEALPLLRQIAEGMDAIHACRVLHLDFKPANVMIETALFPAIPAIRRRSMSEKKPRNWRLRIRNCRIHWGTKLKFNMPPASKFVCGSDTNGNYLKVLNADGSDTARPQEFTVEWSPSLFGSRTFC